ncbi:hypothetical protein IAR50_000197 [Cryptococcus sp. DSM 104548]
MDNNSYPPTRQISNAEKLDYWRARRGETVASDPDFAIYSANVVDGGFYYHQPAPPQYSLPYPTSATDGQGLTAPGIQDYRDYYPHGFPQPSLIDPATRFEELSSVVSGHDEPTSHHIDIDITHPEPHRRIDYRPRDRENSRVDGPSLTNDSNMELPRPRLIDDNSSSYEPIYAADHRDRPRDTSVDDVNIISVTPNPSHELYYDRYLEAESRRIQTEQSLQESLQELDQARDTISHLTADLRDLDNRNSHLTGTVRMLQRSRCRDDGERAEDKARRDADEAAKRSLIGTIRDMGEQISQMQLASTGQSEL